MLGDVAQLKLAIDGNDLRAVKAPMLRNPELHRAPMGYANNGPLTWVAECRVPWEPPSAQRLAIARWMIENGSDVHQGGDGPLMRAALRGERIAMMELLVERGADVNAEWNGDFPILFAPCESVDPRSIRWLLEHGARPDRAKQTALDYLLGTYARSEKLGEAIDALLAAGGTTRYAVSGVLDILRGNLGNLDRDMVHRRYPELDFGSTGGRRLLLSGGTLLHVAAEFGNVEAAQGLLARGADPNARGSVHGQTPLYHSVTQFDDAGLEMTALLLDHGAGLSVRAKVPGHYERPDEFIECTPLEYAIRFPGEEFPGSNVETVALLKGRAR